MIMTMMMIMMIIIIYSLYSGTTSEACIISRRLLYYRIFKENYTHSWSKYDFLLYYDCCSDTLYMTVTIWCRYLYMIFSSTLTVFLIQFVWLLHFIIAVHIFVEEDTYRWWYAIEDDDGRGGCWYGWWWWWWWGLDNSSCENSNDATRYDLNWRWWYMRFWVKASDSKWLLKWYRWYLWWWGWRLWLMRMVKMISMMMSMWW